MREAHAQLHRAEARRTAAITLQCDCVSDYNPSIYARLCRCAAAYLRYNAHCSASVQHIRAYGSCIGTAVPMISCIIEAAAQHLAEGKDRRNF